MTTKQIAEAVGKDPSTVARWIQAASLESQEISRKVQEARATSKPADYTLDETCQIIEEGLCHFDIDDSVLFAIMTLEARLLRYQEVLMLVTLAFTDEETALLEKRAKQNKRSKKAEAAFIIAQVLQAGEGGQAQELRRSLEEARA